MYYGWVITGDDQRWAAAIISKVAPHVPVSAPVVRVSPAVMEALVKINVSSAKLLTRFLTSSEAQVCSSDNHSCHFIHLLHIAELDLYSEIGTPLMSII